MKKLKILATLFTFILLISIYGCGNGYSANSNMNDTEKTTEGQSEHITKINQEEEKDFDGLIDFLVSKGYITKEGDGEGFKEAIGAINGYRYYNLNTLETTEIYEFSDKKDLDNVSVNGIKVTPNKTIGVYAIFSENENLIKDFEKYLE